MYIGMHAVRELNAILDISHNGVLVEPFLLSHRDKLDIFVCFHERAFNFIESEDRAGQSTLKVG